MAREQKYISNPLTLIAVFAGVSETVSAVVLPFLDAALQPTFLWFVMLFPTFLVSIFFFILWNKREVLYAPSDYRDERHFMTAAGYVARQGSSEVLNKFWKPNGVRDRENGLVLQKWMSENGLKGESMTFFLSSDKYLEQRNKAVQDLGLS